MKLDITEPERQALFDTVCHEIAELDGNRAFENDLAIYRGLRVKLNGTEEPAGEPDIKPRQHKGAGTRRVMLHIQVKDVGANEGNKQLKNRVRSWFDQAGYEVTVTARGT